MTDMELAWLAGLLEGEGTFGLRQKNKHYPRVRLSMTDEDVVARAAALMGTSYNRQHTPTQKRLGYTPLYHCVLTCSKAAELMRLIRPHMGERRGARIDELLHIYETRDVNACMLALEHSCSSSS